MVMRRVMVIKLPKWEQISKSPIYGNDGNSVTVVDNFLLP